MFFDNSQKIMLESKSETRDICHESVPNLCGWIVSVMLFTYIIV